MSDIAIQVDRLSKQYRIGRARERHDTLRDAMVATLRAPLEQLARSRRSVVDRPPSADTIWALKDVSFEVRRGEVLGIIGRNGAGKSTLLKILCRITEPTEGRAEIRGRVGSLLEVGTGFHPELTGRENVYLNGAILGMRKVEIDRRFDEIVAFAEIEKFLDTPVKRYSSGMYVRLAFAVAAHLEPEVLLVDEVLAVGDAAFQKKCLGKMGDVAKGGRTVLFVSHSMATVTRLCGRVILLENGGLAREGQASDVVRRYLARGTGVVGERSWPDRGSAPGDTVAKLRAVRVCDDQGHVLDSVEITRPFNIEIEYWNLQSRLRPTAIVHLINEEGICLFATNEWSAQGWWNGPQAPALVRARCNIPGNFLAEGQLFVLAAVGTYNPNVIHVLERDAVSFRVVDRTEGEGVRGDYDGGAWPGVLRPHLEWTVTAEPLCETAPAASQ